jgi:hypothetical protein
MLGCTGGRISPDRFDSCSVNDLLQRQLYLRASEGVAALCSFHGIVKDV